MFAGLAPGVIGLDQIDMQVPDSAPASRLNGLCIDPGGGVRKVKVIALEVLANMIESGEEVPAPLNALFAA